MVRGPNPIWKHFERIVIKDRNGCRAVCKACGFSLEGQLRRMMFHLSTCGAAMASAVSSNPSAVSSKVIAVSSNPSAVSSSTIAVSSSAIAVSSTTAVSSSVGAVSSNASSISSSVSAISSSPSAVSSSASTQVGRESAETSGIVDSKLRNRLGVEKK